MFVFILVFLLLYSVVYNGFCKSRLGLLYPSYFNYYVFNVGYICCLEFCFHIFNRACTERQWSVVR